MAYAVVLIVRSEPGPWVKQSVLQHREIDLRITESYEAGFKLIAKGPCDLFIVFEKANDASLAEFVERLVFDLQNPNLKGIVVTPQKHPVLQQKPVDECLDPAVTLEEFNAAVAAALSFPVRAHRRHRVRMPLEAAGEQGNLTAPMSSVNISEGGMLVESTGELPVGETFTWSFEGAKDLEGLEIPGKILRELEEGRAGDLRLYAVQFVPDTKERCAFLANYLEKTS